MKRHFSALIVICMILALTACGNPYKNSGTHLTLPQNHVEEPQSVNTGERESISAGESDPTNSSESGSLIFERNPGDDKAGDLISGKLVYEVTGARIVTNEKDIPEGGFEEYAFLLMYPDGEEKVYHYPEFIQEDGSFVEGAYLVLLDITVESQNAVNKTIADTDAHGSNGGKYDDPYIFDSDSFFFLVDLSETNVADFKIRIFDQAFFSMYGQREEDSFAFRLLPGETVSFTVGYLVGDRLDGGPRNLSELCFADVIGGSEATYIHFVEGEE